MKPNDFLTLEQFSFLVTLPLQTKPMCVNIHETGRFNMNGKLAEKLSGKPLQIRFTPDAKNLSLQELVVETAIRFPKNGSKRIPSVVEHLTANHIPLPARYEIRYNEKDNFWQGDYCANPTRPPAQRNTNSKKK